jgi:rfaE bifunctional protein kinase chain/domain
LGGERKRKDASRKQPLTPGGSPGLQPGVKGADLTDTRLTRDRLETLLKKMATTKIVVVGDAMLDVYLVGEADRVSPEAPVPVVTVHASRHGLGGAANVAANVATLGAECRLVAVVGEDTRGASVRTELEDLHLTSDYVITDAARPTTSKTRVVARGQQMLRIDEEIDDPIPARVMEQLCNALERALKDADALLIEDYNKGTMVPQVIERGMAIARKRSLPVVVDPKFKNFFAYRGATVFKPNVRELELAMGAALDLAHPDGLPQAVEKLHVDNLLLTLGADGMILVDKDRQVTRIAAMAREVFDVSGAGDTVTAWVGTALAAGASVREAAHIANFAAGIEVGKAGVATVSPAEVLSVHETYYDQLGKLRREGLL